MYLRTKTKQNVPFNWVIHISKSKHGKEDDQVASDCLKSRKGDEKGRSKGSHAAHEEREGGEGKARVQKWKGRATGGQEEDYDFLITQNQFYEERSVSYFISFSLT